MIQVNQLLTQQVALLARLELSEKELQDFTLQLDEILNYIEKLQEVDVQGVEPLTHPFISTLAATATPLRPDEVSLASTDSAGKPKVLQCAPDLLNDSYRVPKILP